MGLLRQRGRSVLRAGQKGMKHKLEKIFDLVDPDIADRVEEILDDYQDKSYVLEQILIAAILFRIGR